MTLPKNRLDGYRWLIEVKDLQLVKLRVKSKVPVGAEKGWASRTRKRSYTDMKFNRNHNAGVLTGPISGIIVLDIDNDKLFPSDYEIPVTFTVQTQKGYHHYFSLPNDGKKYGCRAVSGEGFDIRGEGGYVVAPWSLHPEGITYSIKDDKPFAQAPKWLLDLAVSMAKSKPLSRVKSPIAQPISKPNDFQIPPIREESIKEPTAKGQRSEKIWAVLNELVELGCSDDHIHYIFESHPSGIGEKYMEKGGSRAFWLDSQIQKIRQEFRERFAPPVKALDTASVTKLTGDIVYTLTGYGRFVSPAHEESIRDFVNLLIGLLEGSVNGWYAIPIPVGGGKTQTILHFIKFLYESKKTFSLSVAFEKVEEIENAAQWLEASGVPTTYFQVFHHKVPDAAKLIPTLKSFPVVLHTHQRMVGASYIDHFYRYGGELRKLLIYDESLLNALIDSSLTTGLSAEITRFTREYSVSEEFQRTIPTDITKFFSDFNDLIEREEKGFRKGGKAELPIEPDISMLSVYDLSDLIRYARIIEGKMGETDLYRNILSTACAPENSRKLSLVKENKEPAILVSRELLDNRVTNLITTDASREFRRLFKYTQRSDGKRVKIYDIPNFRWDDELGIWGIALNSGRDSIRKAFTDDPKDNAYLKEISKIVERHNQFNEDHEILGGVKKSKYLFFFPKILTTIPALVELKLIKAGLMDFSETDERLFFANFGQETATNRFSVCDVIVFIGLNHKPKHTIKALLSGEGFLGDPGAILRDAEIGEFLHQLQQGIGRGTIRKGVEQSVYFFHPDSEIFRDALQRAFPMCSFNGKGPSYIPDPDLPEISSCPFGSVQL